MKVFSLQAPIYRGAWLSSRLTAQTSQLAAAIRRDAVARWRSAMAKGLSAEDAAKVVWACRVPPSIAGRRRPSPRASSARTGCASPLGRRRSSRRGWRRCGPTTRCGASASWSAAAPPRRLRRLRLHRRPHPQASLVDRGVVRPVPTLRRKPGGRRFRLLGQQRHAKRLPKGLKPSRPGEIVQLDTLFLNIRPDEADQALHRLRSGHQMDRRLRGNPRHRAISAATFLDKLLGESAFKVKAIQVDGGSEFMADFEQACLRNKGLTLYGCCRPNDRSSMAGLTKPLAISPRAEYLSTISQEIAPSHMG